MIIKFSTLLLPFLISCSAMNKMKMLKAENLTINDEKTLERGLAVYQTHCLRCHGETGLGDGADSLALSKKPTNLQIIAKDKSANSIASNVTFGKGSLMPAFKKELDEKSVWDVSNYIKSWATAEKK